MPAAATILHEPAEVYHAKAAECLTSHQLADFRKCPLLYWKKKQGLVPDEDRPAYLVGRALHTLVLEGHEQFDRESAGTETAKRWTAWISTCPHSVGPTAPKPSIA